MTDDNEAIVLRSWHRNAAAWTRAVRKKAIASRRPFFIARAKHKQSRKDWRTP